MAEETDPAPLTVDALLARARGHGLDLVAAAGDLDESGLDFVVAHARDAAGAPWILRAPRRPEVFAATENEARVLRLLGPRLPVAVPEWRVHAPELIAYPRIAGTPVVTVGEAGPVWHRVDPAAPAECFLESYAAAIAALQMIPREIAHGAGIRSESIADARADAARAIDESRAALAPPAAIFERWQRWLADDDVWPVEMAMVHGDLHPGHMLVDDDARLVGVLDWTEARLGDPSLDLAMFLGCFGRAVTEALARRLAGCGVVIGPRLVDHCAERWAAFPAMIAAWGLRAGNDGVVEHARGMLAAIVASPP